MLEYGHRTLKWKRNIVKSFIEDNMIIYIIEGYTIK